MSDAKDIWHGNLSSKLPIFQDQNFSPRKDLETTKCLHNIGLLNRGTIRNGFSNPRSKTFQAKAEVKAEA